MVHYNKGGKTIQWRKGISPISGAREIGQLHVKNNIFLTPHTKINSKWIKYLNLRLDTLKLFKGRQADSL